MAEPRLALTLVAAGALLAGFVTGLAGFGSALVALPLGLQAVEPRVAAPLAVLCGLAAQPPSARVACVSSRPCRTAATWRVPMTGTTARALLMAIVLLPAAAVPAGEPGRLEADAEFLLGHWSSDCAGGSARIFLSDGALRQQGLLLVGAADGGQPQAPVTLLAATRDGVGLLLESATRVDGLQLSARYTARVVSEERIELKSLTLCRGARCRTTALDLPWTRCPSPPSG